MSKVIELKVEDIKCIDEAPDADGKTRQGIILLCSPDHMITIEFTTADSHAEVDKIVAKLWNEFHPKTVWVQEG